MANDEIGDRLSSVRFASLCWNEFLCGGRHENGGRDTELFGEMGDLADVQVAFAR